MHSRVQRGGTRQRNDTVARHSGQTPCRRMGSAVDRPAPCPPPRCPTTQSRSCEHVIGFGLLAARHTSINEWAPVATSNCPRIAGHAPAGHPLLFRRCAGSMHAAAAPSAIPSTPGSRSEVGLLAPAHPSRSRQPVASERRRISHDTNDLRFIASRCSSILRARLGLEAAAKRELARRYPREPAIHPVGYELVIFSRSGPKSSDPIPRGKKL